MRALPLLLLGCGEPISNAVFYEDEAFLAALPSPDRIGLSPRFAGWVVDGDTDPLLAHALAEAEALDPKLSLVTGLAEVLRATTPSARSSTHRRWAARSVVAPDGASAGTWWVRAEMARAEAGADLRWSVEGALGADGPWIPLGSGRHDPEGLGTLAWDLGASGALLGLDLGQGLDITYEDLPNAERAVVLRIPASPVELRELTLDGDEGFGWTGRFAWGDTEPVSGLARIALGPSGAGAGRGELLREGATVSFAACWGADGRRLWAVGEGAVGEPGDCQVLPPPP